MSSNKDSDLENSRKTQCREVLREQHYKTYKSIIEDSEDLSDTSLKKKKKLLNEILKTFPEFKEKYEKELDEELRSAEESDLFKKNNNSPDNPKTSVVELNTDFEIETVSNSRKSIRT